MYETTPEDFLRLTGVQDRSDIAVVRMQGLLYRANEDDIVRETRKGGSVARGGCEDVGVGGQLENEGWGRDGRVGGWCGCVMAEGGGRGRLCM